MLAGTSRYSTAINGRFRGGYITRRYGRPDDGVHAIQLELAQDTYMDEKDLGYDETRAAGLAGTIRAMLEAFVEHGTK